MRDLSIMVGNLGVRSSVPDSNQLSKAVQDLNNSVNQDQDPKTPISQLKSSANRRSTHNRAKSYQTQSLNKTIAQDFYQPKPIHNRVKDLFADRYYQQNPEENGYANNNDNIQLVPCRWSHIGWKYVNRDPSQDPYFQNPNRVNFTGMNHNPMLFQKQGQSRTYQNSPKPYASPTRENLNKTQINYPAKTIDPDQFQTTYAKVHSPEIHKEYLKLNQTTGFEGFNEIKQQRLGRRLHENQQMREQQQQQLNEQDPGFLWGGAYHARKSFNKKRDFMKDWTDVLFRN